MVSICTSVSAAPYTIGTLTPVPAGTASWTWVWDSGPGGTYHDVQSYDSGFTTITHQLTQTLVNPSSIGVTSTPQTVPGGAVWFADVYATGTPGTYCGTYHFYDSVGAEVSGGAGPAFCAYGTEPIASTTAGVIVTTGLIDLLLSASGIGAWAAIIFDTFVGKVLYSGDLCAGPPPAMPVFTTDDFLFGDPSIPNPTSLAKWWQGMLAVAWPYFCKCSPAPFGSPTPLDYPAPTAIAPAGAPTGPTIITCEGVDLCTVLNELARQLAAMQTQVAVTNQYVQLIQRQKVPFGYLPGALHSELAGSGQFVVSDILGLAVQVTTVPGASGEESGNPIARFGLGWVTTGTADGWRKSVAIRHNPQWVDVEPDDTLIGYSLEPLVIANIEEFIREP